MWKDSWGRGGVIVNICHIIVKVFCWWKKYAGKYAVSMMPFISINILLRKQMLTNMQFFKKVWNSSSFSERLSSHSGMYYITVTCYIFWHDLFIIATICHVINESLSHDHHVIHLWVIMKHMKNVSVSLTPNWLRTKGISKVRKEKWNNMKHGMEWRAPCLIYDTS